MRTTAKLAVAATSAAVAALGTAGVLPAASLRHRTDALARLMKQAVGNVGYSFNSARMMRRYATEAYLR